MLSMLNGIELIVWDHPEIFSGKMSIECKRMSSLHGAQAVSGWLLTVNPDHVSYVIYEIRNSWVEVPGEDSDWHGYRPASVDDISLVGNHQANHRHLDDDGCGVTVYQPVLEGSDWGVVYAVGKTDV